MQPQYVSTRGGSPAAGFEEVLFTGLAPDGGLYVPQTWPQLSPEKIASFAGMPYHEVAYEIISLFTGDTFTETELRQMLKEAYATFTHQAVVPLVQLDASRFVLEIFHGPTLAFKDIAMQILSRMVDNILEKRKKKAVILGATSGDTGGAAIEAFRACKHVDIFILYPHGRVSDVQRRQMTTVGEPHVHTLAIKGSFDDCQNIVKAAFNDRALRAEMPLIAVNSINWARIAAQVVYYFVSAVALGTPHRPVSFVVPTGNFGNIFAGFVAKKMGLPIETLTAATNANDILFRALTTGAYEIRESIETLSPSMDIQISSNFERLVFESLERDAPALSGQMSALKTGNAFTLSEKERRFMDAGFRVGRADDATILDTIRSVHERTGYVLDPHTATAMHVSEQNGVRAGVPEIILSTAHPAKFPDAVKKGCGHWPDLPAPYAHIMERDEKIAVVENSYEAVTGFVRERRG